MDTVTRPHLESKLVVDVVDDAIVNEALSIKHRTLLWPAEIKRGGDDVEREGEEGGGKGEDGGMLNAEREQQQQQHTGTHTHTCTH